MSTEIVTTISPNTNKPLLSRPTLSDQHLATLPAASAKAFSSFSCDVPLAKRRDIVRKALQLLSAKRDELAHELTEQMGRPISYTGKEIDTAVKRGEYLLRISEDCLKNTEGEEEEGFKRYIKRMPIGPVLILFAWNVSLLLRSLRFPASPWNS